MAEEQRWQEPEGHRLCANNCGFFGSPTTLNLCSKCYKDHCLKEQQASKAMLAVEKSLTQVVASASSSVVASSDSASSDVQNMPVISVHSENVKLPEIPAVPAVTSDPVVAGAAQPNRCATCRRRVGLAGFRCRCGTTFCGTHRYPEQHGCTFNFKATGREAIAKGNPIIKAEKLEKI